MVFGGQFWLTADVDNPRQSLNSRFGQCLALNRIRIFMSAFHLNVALLLMQLEQDLRKHSNRLPSLNWFRRKPGRSTKFTAQTLQFLVMLALSDFQMIRSALKNMVNI